MDFAIHKIKNEIIIFPYYIYDLFNSNWYVGFISVIKCK